MYLTSRCLPKTKDVSFIQVALNENAEKREIMAPLCTALKRDSDDQVWKESSFKKFQFRMEKLEKEIVDTPFA